MNKALYDFIVSNQHHKFRRDIANQWAYEYKQQGLPPIERMADRFERLCNLEQPVILPHEKICFMRTVKNIPDIFTLDEWEEVKSKHFIHERGYWSNLCPNYEDAIKHGLLEKRKRADEYGKRAIDNIIKLSDKYKDEAMRQGNTELASVLTRVPRYGATNFREALQFFRILHFSLWLEGNYHNTIGRFDKYMYPYLKADLESGRLTRESALELVEDFFLSFNKDNDLYPGIQQGDNGQSLMLGGIDGNGNEVFNLLSELCLEASHNLKLIDPKINIRVNKNTPINVYISGSKLTKVGLGFPQYSNDDVVIKGLTDLRYEYKDACNYTVAACWEFIIPHKATDIVNIAALSFPKVIDICLHESLENCNTFEEFMKCVNEAMNKECDRICNSIKDVWFVPSPFLNVLMDCNLESGGKYNNFGIHGSGLATAADSLAAIKKYIFEQKTITKQELIEAVDSNFLKHNELLPLLRYKAPKFGNNDDYVDSIATELLNMFSDCLKHRRNCKGGIYRAGTGTAMYYLWHANEIGAGPDGRREKEPLGANLSPSLFARTKGMLSTIQSVSKLPFEKAINGGPLTIEFHSSVFSSEDSIEKVARLVKTYMDMGGHQLQLNTVNPETLKDAQKHPEKYRQLVVRVWGWSAYFVELDKEFQDHIIARHAYSI